MVFSHLSFKRVKFFDLCDPLISYIQLMDFLNVLIQRVLHDAYCVRVLSCCRVLASAHQTIRAGLEHTVDIRLNNEFPRHWARVHI
jgi:hypothetical protein